MVSSLQWWNTKRFLPIYCKLPIYMQFFLVNLDPGLNQLQLFWREFSFQHGTVINGYGSLIFLIADMNVR